MSKKILSDLGKILEKKNLKESDKISTLKVYDSIIILQIINLAKINYKKEVDGLKLAEAKTIADIIKLLD
tara:strand:- start:7502 stop:7711 length:210 start_codon:yes stop_codon:yes gene_type:complete